MSDVKVTAREFLSALGRGDVERLGSLMTEDISAVCTGTCALSGTRTYKDIYATAGLLGKVTRSGIEFRILNMTAEDDRVAVEVDGIATLVNGAPYNNQYHFLFFVRDGKVYRIKEYLDTKLVDTVLVPLMVASSSPA